MYIKYCMLFWTISIHDTSLLLLLSRFSHVRLPVTPQMAAHQALPSLGFSSLTFFCMNLRLLKITGLLFCTISFIWACLMFSPN